MMRWIALLLLAAAPLSGQVFLRDTLVPYDSSIFIRVPVANTVSSVSVDAGTLTVVTRDNNAAAQTTTFVVGGGSGQPGTGGLTQGQVDARIRAQVPVQPVIVGFTEFEHALRHEAALCQSCSVNVSISDAAYRLPGAPKVPSAEDNRQLVVTVTPTSTGVASSRRFNLAALLLKPAVGQTTQLTSSNSVEFTLAGVLYFIARETGDNQLLFSADTIDTYAVTVIDSRVDVQAAARLGAPPIAETARDVVAAALVAGGADESADVIATHDDASNTITLEIAPAHVDPSELRFDANTRVGGRVVTLNSGATGFSTIHLGGAQVVHDGSINSVAVTSTSGNHRSAWTAFSPAFDLDDHASGEFHSELRLTMVTGSDPALGFGAGHPSTYREADLSFASAVAATADYTTGGAAEGIVVASVQMFQGTIGLGQLRLLLSHNAANQLGYVFDYVGGGSQIANFTYSSLLALSFTPSDASGGGGGGGNTLTGDAASGRGALIVSTPALSTAPVASYGVVRTAWARDSAQSSSRYGRSGSQFYHTLSGGFAAKQIGYWIEAQVSGVRRGLPVLVPFMMTGNSDGGDAFQMYLSSECVIAAVAEVTSSFGRWALDLSADEDGCTAPANTRLYIYEWLMQ